MEKSHKKAVDFATPLAFHAVMRRRVYVITLSLLALLIFPQASIAVEIAPRISDREIIERLTRLEEGQKHLETSLGAKIQANAEATLQFQLTLGILGAFAAIVAATIGFALWDRGTIAPAF
jgi:hypothetical protein